MKKENQWGGKREGAGRKQETPYTSKPRSIYCTKEELISLKAYLKFLRAFRGIEGRDILNPAEYYNVRELPSGVLLDYLGFRDKMEEESPHNYQALTQAITQETKGKLFS